MTEPADAAWPYPVAPFVCHRCGNCCRGEGYVVLTEEDIAGMAEVLGLERADFLGRHAKWNKSLRAHVLLDKQDELKSCIFLNEDNTCVVHASKPQQCRDFPMKWRPENILDFCEGWRAAAGLKPAAKKTMSQ
jgi:Fe-S-cluster containining protein